MKKIIIGLSLIFSTVVFAERNWGRVEENIRERVRVEKIIKTTSEQKTKKIEELKKIEEYKKNDREKVFEANRITEKWD